KIDNQLVTMIEKSKKDQNKDEMVKLAQFQRTWRSHKITGSINREDVEVLETAASQLGVEASWNLSGYFRALGMSLAQIIAGEEELPRIENPQEPRLRGKVSPPMSSFGPKNEKLSGAENKPPTDEELPKQGEPNLGTPPNPPSKV